MHQCFPRYKKRVQQRTALSDTTHSTAFPNDDFFLRIDIPEQHRHILKRGGRDILADVVRADGQLPVTAIDEDSELDHARPTDVEQCVHRRADCRRDRTH